MSRKLTQKEVLERFKKVHGDKYDYSEVKYVNQLTKVKLICKELSKRMIENNVGVSVVETYHVKRIDNDFFNDEVY